MVTQKQVIEGYYEIVKQISDIGYEEVLSKRYDIQFSSRMTRTLGLCTHMGGPKYRITLNIKFMNACNEVDILNTIAHELIHSINGCMNHGEKWKYIANLMNKEYGYHISRTSYYKEYIESLPKPQYKYKVICNHCQNAWYYKKRTKVINSIFKNPNSCTCPHCRQKSFSIVNI